MRGVCELFYEGWEQELEDILIDHTDDLQTLQQKLCHDISLVYINLN